MLVIGATPGEYARFAAGGSSDREHSAAIAWATDPDRSRLLLVRHRVFGWSCPGGHVEPGERPAEAARRELREETGLDLAPVTDVPLFVTRHAGCRRGPGPAVDWVHGFLFEVDGATTAVVGEPGQPAAWFAVDALPMPRAADVDVVALHVGR